LNCFEIGGGEGLFVAEKNTQEKSRNGGGGEEGRTSGHKLRLRLVVRFYLCFVKI